MIDSHSHQRLSGTFEGIRTEHPEEYHTIETFAMDLLAQGISEYRVRSYVSQQSLNHNLQRAMDIFRTLAKTGGVEVLRALKDGNLIWNELMKDSGLNSHTLSVRTRELMEAGLIAVRYDQIGRRPLYMFTATGRRILELLEEKIERVYREGASLEEREERKMLEEVR